MSRLGDGNNRQQVVQRDLKALGQTTDRTPMAPAAPEPGATITIGGGFSIGDAVKCVAGVWSLVTSGDQKNCPGGIVIASSSGVCTVQLDGTRLANGTAGTVYYASAGGGPADPTYPSSTAWERIVEVQINPLVRQICWSPLVRRLVPATICQDGVEKTISIVQGPDDP